MKKATVVVHSATRSDHGIREAFAEGLRRRGCDVRMSFSPDAGDLLVMWGTRRQDAATRQKAAGSEVCILERGYLGDRMAWTSVSFGGALEWAEFRGVRDDPSRFEGHFGNLMQPWRWRFGNGYALLIGQVPGDMSIRGVDIEAWYRSTHAALIAAGSLAENLAEAALVVTFNSNTGVESVLAGVPTITSDCGAMAWPVAGHAVGEVIMPDREAWAHQLAWKQYTIDEIRSGECQERIGL